MSTMDLKLMNSSEFAKMCGVTTQTVLNWVKSGKVIPAQSVGTKHYFTERQFVQIQLGDLKYNGIPAFLGVIVGDSEESVLFEKMKFVKVVTKFCPNIREINDLVTVYLDILNTPTVELSAQSGDVFGREVVNAFCQDFRKSCLDFIMEICLNVEGAMYFSMRFLLSMLLDDNPDETLLAKYSSLPINDIRHSVGGIKRTTEVFYSGLIDKYGLRSSIGKVTMKDVYELKTNLLLTKDLYVDKTAIGAKRILDKMVKKVSMASRKSVFNQICNDGYYTIIKAVKGFSDDDENFLVERLATLEYSKFYTNNINALPKQIRTLLHTYEESGKIEILSM